MRKIRKEIAVVMSCVMISQSMMFVQAENDISDQNIIIEVTGTDAAPNFMDQSSVTATGYVYQIKSDKTVVITGYQGTNTNLTIPATIDGKKVTTIGSGAFKENYKIQKVIISEGITTIGSEAFSGCKKLTEVSIPSTITSLDGSYEAFKDCELLRTVTLKQGTKDVSMASYMFKNCKNLQKITIPKNYVSIGYSCFDGCANMTSFTWNGDSSKELKINSRAFYECKSLTAANIPEGVISIGTSAFYNCTSLASVVIPSTMEEIGPTSSTSGTSVGVFAECKNLKSVTIKAGEQSAYIGEYSFINCQSLQSISIPGNYERIYNSAFANCTGLKTMEYKSSNMNYSNQIIDFNAFGDCKNLTNITLSKSLGEIKGCAFQRDVALKSVTISEGTFSIGTQAFYKCTSLESLSLPSTIETLGSQVFEGCSMLKNISWAAGSIKATIGSSSFRSCTSLVSVTIPGNCDTIE